MLPSSIKSKTSQNLIRYLISIIKNILAKDAQANIQVMRDFNFHITTLTKQINQLGLKGFLEPNVPTHSSRNQIVQIYTNKKITGSFTSNAPFPSHHSTITTTIQLASDNL